jgi:hypothetical protein
LDVRAPSRQEDTRFDNSGGKSYRNFFVGHDLPFSRLSGKASCAYRMPMRHL